MNQGERAGNLEIENNNKIQLRYCHERDITYNNRRFLMFKACFLIKIRNLELNG